MLSQVVELIEHKGRFAITSHLRPDGDSLGSSLGLYWLLRALNKDVEVIMRDPVPHTYQKLPGADDVRVTPAADQSYDGVFVIECSDMARPGLQSLESQTNQREDWQSQPLRPRSGLFRRNRTRIFMRPERIG